MSSVWYCRGIAEGSTWLLEITENCGFRGGGGYIIRSFVFRACVVVILAVTPWTLHQLNLLIGR